MEIRQLSGGQGCGQICKMSENMFSFPHLGSAGYQFSLWRIGLDQGKGNQCVHCTLYTVHCTLYTVQERKEIKQSLSSWSSWWSHLSPPSPLAHLPRLGCSRVSFLHFLIISSFNSFLKRSILLRSRRVFFFLVSLLFSSFILFFYAKKTLGLNFFTRIYL